MKNLNRLIIFVLLTSFTSVQTGCSPKPMKDSKAEAKFDAPLRMKLSEVKQAKVDAPLTCLVKLNGSLDEKKRKMLKEAGINVVTVIKTIATIEGRPDAIRQIATYDFVHSISLSQTRYPLEKK